MKNTKYVIIDGLDKSGKSSVIKMMKDKAEDVKSRLNVDHIIFCEEPIIGGPIRDILLSMKSYELTDEADVMLFYADRLQKKEIVLDKIGAIRAEYGEDDIILVVSDRSFMTTFAYQQTAVELNRNIFDTVMDGKNILASMLETHIIIFDVDINTAKNRMADDESSSDEKFEMRTKEFFSNARKIFINTTADEVRVSSYDVIKVTYKSIRELYNDVISNILYKLREETI